MKKNKLALVAFLLSLIWLGPIALILGSMSLAQIKKSNEGFRGLAVAAVILGSLETAILVYAVVSPYDFAYTLGFIWGSLTP